MSLVCSGCGATNEGSPLRCEYCGNALAESSTLVLEWTASTHEGAHARGRAELHAPAGADSERVRQWIQSAYSSVVDELGPRAGAAQIRDALWAKLETLLPDDHRLQDLSVSEHGLASQGGGVARVGCSVLALLLSAVAACSLFCGAFGIWMRGDFSAQIEALEAARAITPSEAASAEGLVCIEAAVLEAEEPLVLPHSTLAEQDRPRCVYYKGQPAGGASQERKLDRFQVGGLTVETAELKLNDPEELGPPDSSDHWVGFALGNEYGLVGEVKGGVMRGGEVFVLSSHSTKDALLEDLRSGQQAGTVWAALCSMFGVFLFLPAVILLFRRGR